MGAPVRVGGGYIEVTPEVDQKVFLAKMQELGKLAAGALSGSISKTLNGSMSTLIGSTNKATSAIANLSAAQTRAFTAQQRASASLASTAEKTAAREQKAAETTAKVKAAAEKTAAKATVLEWTDAYGKIRFVTGEFDKLQQLRLSKLIGKVREVSSLEMKFIQTTQTAREVASKKRIAEIDLEAKLQRAANNDLALMLKGQLAQDAAAEKVRKAALISRNSLRMTLLRAAEAADNADADNQLRSMKLVASAEKAFRAQKLADIQAEKLAEGNAIKQIIADYKTRMAAQSAATKQALADDKALKASRDAYYSKLGAPFIANIKAEQAAYSEATRRAIADDKARAVTNTATTDKIKFNLHGMASTLTQAGHALTYSLSGPLLLAGGYAAKVGVQFTDLKNRTTAAIEAFKGKAVAQNIVDTLTKMSTQMPVAVEDMYQMAQRLSALKTNAAPVTDEVLAFSRAIAAMHLNTSQSSRSMIQFQHIVMGYNVNAKELNTLTTDGIPAWDLLARAMGKSVAQLKEMSKSGTLLSKDVTPKLVAFLNSNKEYANSIKASGESLQGAWIRLKNVFKVGLATDSNSAGVRNLAKSINGFTSTLNDNMPAIQNFVGKVVDFGTKLVHYIGLGLAAFNSLPSSVKKATGSVMVFAIVLGPLLKVAGALTHVFGAVRILIGGLAKMRGALSAVGLIAGESNPVGWIITAIAVVVAAFVVAWKNSALFRAEIKILWAALKDLFSTISASIGPIWKGLTDSFNGTGKAAKGFGDYLASAVNELRKGVDWISQNWATFGAGIVLGFRTLVSVVHDEAVPTLKIFWNIIKGAAGALWSLGTAIFNGVAHLLSLDSLTQKASNSTSGLVIRGGALGKTMVYLMTAFQVAGRGMGAIINVIGVVANAFIGLINVIASVGGLLVDVFTGNWGDLGNKIKSIGGNITGAVGQIRASASAAGGAISSLFPSDVSKLLASNAAQFNSVFDSIQSSMQTKPYVSKVTPAKKTGADTASGGAQVNPNAAADAKKAAAAAKAAQALADRIAAARDSLVNALKDFKASITGSASQINTATKALESKVTSAFDVLKKHDTGQKLVTYLRGVNTQLQALANQRDAITKAIADNKAYRTTVTDNAMGTATLNNLTYSPTNAYGIKFGLQQRLAQIKQFGSMIKDLAKRGLNKTLLREVIDAGPIDGAVLAASLMEADKATFKAINTAQTNIDKASKDLGNTAGDMIFGSITTLTKKGKSLQDQMNKIANDAIAKVARAFGIGWSTINSITGTGMTTVNSTMTNSLTKTSVSVSNATTGIKTSWGSMIASMNTATGQLVNVTYSKGVKGTVDAMAKIAGAKSPAPILKYSHGGTVPGYAPRRDTVPAMLSPGEGIMVPELARQVGSDQLSVWNRLARLGKNVFANGGTVNGYDWITKHENDPTLTSYDTALSGALKAVVDPARAALAKVAGNAGALESGDEKAGYPFLHTWAKKLDAMVNAGGNAAAVLNVARKELGTGENPPGSNRVKYDNFNGEQWCADFVSWVVDHAHANGAYFNSPSGTPNNRWAAVAGWKAKAGKSLPVSQAQPGDLAYYGDSHINIVEKNLGGGRVMAIGGNQSNAVTEGTYGPDGVLRPHLPKSAGGQTANPWPGSLGQLFGALGGAIGGGGTPATNQSLGQKISSSLGWGSYWPSLKALWNRESSWNNLAMNKQSGAFGIAQALGHGVAGSGGKYGNQYPNRAANDGDPSSQINWGLNYIKGRYGNPANAWSHETSIGWYKDGAWELLKDQFAVVHAGEMVVPKAPATAIRRSLSTGKAIGGKGDTIYSTTINAAPDVPTEKTVTRALSYVHTMYGGNS